MKTSLFTTGISAFAILASAWVASINAMNVPAPSTTATRPVKKAQAILWPTQGNTAQGKVSFTVVEGGVKIIADVDDLTPGKHGFHIHEHGDCSAPDASSAGGHFNPTGSKHGSPDSSERHAGDLGNLVADNNGHAHYERIDTVITLDGPHSIIGRSIIIHEKEDDFKTQPAGNAGARVACGIIERQ